MCGRFSFFGASLRGFVAFEIKPLHVSAGVGQGAKAQGGVDVVGVAGQEAEAADAGEAGVVDGSFDHFGGDMLAAVGVQDEDIAEVGEGGAVGDDASEADLLGCVVGVLVVRAPAERVCDGAFEAGASDAGRPVAGAEKVVDDVEVEERVIDGDVDGHEEVL